MTNDGATKKEIVQAVMPEHPLGYDVDAMQEKMENGDRYRSAWWRKIVKAGLAESDAIEKREPQESSGV